MITSIIIGALALTILFLTSAILHIKKIQNELISLDKEQHQQNKEIIQLIKANVQHGEMLMQHIEILKYLVEQDPTLGRKVMYTGPIGEA